MPSRSDVEKWCGEQSVSAIMSGWYHIASGHILDPKTGTAPPGKSYFTEDVGSSVSRVYDTIITKQNRLLCDASAPSRAIVVRDFSPSTIGKDGRNAADCTHCVVVLGLASSGAKKGKPIVITAYPASARYVAGLVPL